MDASSMPSPSPESGNEMDTAESKPVSTDHPSSASNHKLRKRTKTGCLTCRKRRIKCGEERPTCKNCVRSKRLCEGYNQRIVFKPPMGDFPSIYHGPAQTLQYHSGMLPRTQPDHPHARQAPTATVSPTSPRHDDRYQHYHNFVQPTEPIGSAPPVPYGVNIENVNQQQQPVFFPPKEPIYPDTTKTQGQAQDPVLSMPHQALKQNVYQPPIAPALDRSESISKAPTQLPRSPESQGRILPDHQAQTSFQHVAKIQPPYTPISDAPQTNHGVSVFEYTPESQSERPQPPEAQSTQPPQNVPVTGDLHLEIDTKMLAQSTPALPTPSSSKIQQTTSPTYQQNATGNVVGTTQMLDDAAVEIQDDDYYDVQSDDEMEVVPEEAPTSQLHYQRDFSLILSLHRESTSELSIRRYDAFIYEGILDYYRAEWVANPLKNPKTARVFAHFIHSTAPSLSAFDRNPRNASALFNESPVPLSQQGLWTYTLPMMALSHQGLLHAILALASLHISRLQGASATPSFKHYAYSLKRIRHCVRHPRKRHLVTTLAATLLLGYYEVMTADHVKWNSHIAGAKQLLVEIDFIGMSQDIKRMRREEAEREHSLAISNPTGYAPHQYQSLHVLSSDVDEGLVSTFIGRKLKYDQFGQVLGEQYEVPYKHKRVPVDPNKYDLYQDLFWWYCKQDAYQSVVSGNKPLMDYCRWSDCPPRAPLGRSDALYGTHDHLLLLLGRIADFSSRDRARKIKVMEANGGAWRPGPGFPGGPPTSMNPRGGPPKSSPQSQRPQEASSVSPIETTSKNVGHVPHPRQTSSGNVPPAQSSTAHSEPPSQSPVTPAPPRVPQMPSFYGMAPAQPQTQLPSSFDPDRSPSSASSPGQDITNLDVATATALDEWQQIRSALHVFASHLGPAFRPLSAEYHLPLATPFGESLHHRSYDISLIWASYNMCQIILWRSHPSMPPAAMMAAGIAAAQTAASADEIGRICAGIVPSAADTPLNPSLGAAIIESTLPLFFAGVQFVDPAKRVWVIQRLRDVEVLTGWHTASLIALGCETAWESAAKAGKGPPYMKQVQVHSADDRLADRIVSSPAAPPPNELSDRRFIHMNPGTRLHWALGLLADEEDLRKTGTV